MHTQRRRATDLSRDGRTLALGTHDEGGTGAVQLWDVTDRYRPVRIFATRDEQRVSGVAFSPDQRTLATVTAGEGAGSVQLWDLTDPQAPTRLARVPNDPGRAVAFSPDGRRLAVATGGSTTPWIQLWDVSDRDDPRRVAAVPDAGYGGAVAFSPDGRLVAEATASKLGPYVGNGAVHPWRTTGDHALTRLASVPPQGFAQPEAGLREQHPQQPVTHRPAPLPPLRVPARARLTDVPDLLGVINGLPAPPHIHFREDLETRV